MHIKGQNLAAAHKCWIDKLRCASCSHIVTADIPDCIGTEKYDTAFKAILALQKYYVTVPCERFPDRLLYFNKTFSCSTYELKLILKHVGLDWQHDPMLLYTNYLHRYFFLKTSQPLIALLHKHEPNLAVTLH